MKTSPWKRPLDREILHIDVVSAIIRFPTFKYDLLKIREAK